MAWAPLGWKASAFAEIEPFPCAVLEHHYPNVPNYGDMTKFKDWPDAKLDLLCGGTPCQSFSVAGLREGLDDPRGDLMLTFGAIAARYRPRWLVWENVPGVLSSNGGRDFGVFLGLLGVLGYGFAYRVLDAQFVRVDGYGRAVPQRRNRVFVVGCLGDWRSAAAVLLERESLRGDSAPRRQAGPRTAARPARSLAIRGREGIASAELGDDIANAILTPGGGRGGVGVGALMQAYGGNNTRGPVSVSSALSALSAHGGSGRMDFESETFIAHTLRGDGFDASEDGTGRGTPLVPVANSLNGNSGRMQIEATYLPSIAFGWQNSASQSASASAEITPTLDKSKTPGLLHGAAVRRLTPTECERLQGFPDGYTQVPFRGKPAADGPRYKALGNSWAVNCARWIGRRIEIVEQIHAARKDAA